MTVNRIFEFYFCSHKTKSTQWDHPVTAKLKSVSGGGFHFTVNRDNKPQFSGIVFVCRTTIRMGEKSITQRQCHIHRVIFAFGFLSKQFDMNRFLIDKAIWETRRLIPTLAWRLQKFCATIRTLNQRTSSCSLSIQTRLPCSFWTTETCQNIQRS